MPVRGADNPGTNFRSFRGGLKVGTNRPSVGVDSFCPVQFLRELRGREKFAVGAVENVQKAVAVRFYQEFARLPLVHGIHENGSFRGVIVKKIVGRELEIPFEFAGLGIQGEYAIGIEIIAGPRPAIEIRSWVAGSPVQRIEFGIVGAGHPGGAAAAQIGLPGPTGRAELAGAGYGPETPHLLTGLRIEGRDEPANAVVAAGCADENFAVHDEGSAGGAVVFVALGVRDVPEEMAGAHIQAEQMSVVRFQEDPGVPDSIATVV